MFVVVRGETGDDAWRVMFTAVNACHVTKKRGVYNNHQQQTIASSHSTFAAQCSFKLSNSGKRKTMVVPPWQVSMAYGEEWPWVRQSEI